MTGHGQSIVQDEQVQVLVEVRSVNNRFLKINVNNDLDVEYQSRIEAMVRERIKRGSVNLRVRVQFLGSVQDYEINVAAIKAYRNQLRALGDQASIDALLTLPGVVSETADSERIDVAWPSIQLALRQALDKLIEMRTAEGNAMQNDLIQNCQAIGRQVEFIKTLAPGVPASYARRITERVNQLLEEHGVSVIASDLVREVGIFADRVDICEELVRLDSHLSQFQAVARSDQSDGRKLDFLTQELLRETNTIGSKANDAEIAGHVIEIKTNIERIREMVQNIE
jgi:uncharacterized protein (TIGR00255 family)